MRSRATDKGQRLPAEALRARLAYDDAALLAECEVHTFRASGPGGQKRNKTSSAVRLHHGPSGVVVKAAESRSQHENKARALRRLREALAVEIRCPLPQRVAWPPGVQIVDGTLRLTERSPALVPALALTLDALAECRGSVAGAAARLGLHSSSLTRLWSEHRSAWAAANRIRTGAGLPPLCV